MKRSKSASEKVVIGSWVQVDRAAHLAWIGLYDESPMAAKLLHLLVSKLGKNNAVVASQDTLASWLGCSGRTIRRATEVLKAGRWVELRYISGSGGAYAYVLNSRVAWSGPRSGIKYGFLDASLILRDVDQKDGVGADEELRPAPVLINGNVVDPETGEVLSGPKKRVDLSASEQLKRLRSGKRPRLRLV